MISEVEAKREYFNLEMDYQWNKTKTDLNKTPNNLKSL